MAFWAISRDLAAPPPTPRDAPRYNQTPRFDLLERRLRLGTRTNVFLPTQLASAAADHRGVLLKGQGSHAQVDADFGRFR